MGIIYQALNKISGKSYIGQTTGLLRDRRKEHERDSRKGSLFAIHCALRKYGFGNFKWSILYDNIGDDELDIYETSCIRKLNSSHTLKIIEDYYAILMAIIAWTALFGIRLFI